MNDIQLQILAHVIKSKQTTFHEIERATNLRQPVISVHTNDLIKQGILKRIIPTSHARGRPTHYLTYYPAATKAALNKLMDRRRNTFDKAQSNLISLYELIP